MTRRFALAFTWFGAWGCAAPEAGGADPRGDLLEEGPVVCADPGLRGSLGAMVRGSLGPDWDSHQPVGWEGDYAHGEGFAVADLTGDGRLDVVIADRSALVFYASTAEGSWREESAARLPDLRDPDFGAVAAATVAAVDLDEDGALDLYVGRYPLPDVLLLNRGDGTFVSAPEGALPATEPRRVRGTPFADIDADGDLDLFVAADHQGQLPPDPGDPNALYENLGGGTFRDVTERLSPEDVYGYSRIAGFFDADGDGAQDLYIVNHMPIYQTNRLLYGDGAGGFVSGVEAGADIFTSGMGLGLGDLGGDGLPDLVVSGWGELAVLETFEARGYADAALARGLIPEEADARVVAWGNELADLDNDGRLDVVVAFGQAEEEVETGESNPPDEPDGVWLQDEAGGFEQVAESWGVAQTGDGRAVAAVDLDGDGWLDLLTQGHKEAPVVHFARCGEASWLTVQLRGRAPNTGAVGAKVTVEAGGHTQTRWTTVMGTGLQTSLPPQVHVGLGDAERVDRLLVEWPDGERSEWMNVAARQVVVARAEGVE